MGIDNYMRQGADGKINMLLDNIPEIGFIDAIRTKNIYKAKILNRADRANLESGSPDVKLISSSGNVKYISRRELANNFVLSNGSKIRLAFINSNKEYFVYNICNEQCKILKLPDNCYGTFKGKNVKPGSYMVCNVNNDGAIDMSTADIISPSMFRKMFKIPLQAVIKRHIGSGSKNFTLFSNRDKIKQINQMYRPKFDSSKIGMNPSNIHVDAVNNTPNTENKVWKPSINIANRNKNNVQETQDTNNSTNYRFRVLNKIVDMDGRLLGFTVQEIATGKTKKLNTNELTKLCVNKLVENVMVVRNTRGTLYLKGNGCRLEALPQVIA